MNMADTPITELLSMDRLLEKAADTAYQAVLAISQGEHAEARRLLDQLRFLRAGVQHQRQLPAPAPDAPGASAITTKIRCARESLAIADEVVQGWVAQRVGAVVAGEVSDPVEIWQCLIDQVLPVCWDFDVDLFVVFGHPDVSLQAALEQRGQRRVLVVCQDAPGEPGPAALPDGYRVAGTDAQIRATLEQLERPYPHPDRLASLCLHEAGEADPKIQEQTALIKKTLLGLWMNLNTYKRFGKVWLEHGVGNLPLLAAYRNLSELDGVFRGRPAVLIAPGPSLEKNIDQIAALKGRALLVAPLQTLRRLHRANIQPDFLVVLDAADQTRAPCDFFGDVPDDFLPPVIAAVNVHPAVLARFRTVYVFVSGGPLDTWAEASLGEPLPTFMAPSVAIIGLLVANHWGCSPIILTGQDLSFKDGQQYAAGSQLRDHPNRRLYTLPGFWGEPVQSPSDYYMFHHRFELLAKAMAAQPAPPALYNCTEGGAYIEGFEHRRLQDVVADHLGAADGTGQPLHIPVATAPEADWHRQRSRQVSRHLTGCLATIDAAVQQAAHCQRLSVRAASGGALLKKLATEESRLRSLIQRISGFSVLYQTEMDRALQASARAKNLHDNLCAARALYALVTEGCAFLRPLVVQALAACVSPAAPEQHDPVVSSASVG